MQLAPLVDFVGPHVYPMEDDEVRQLLTAAFTCELAGSFGKPVVLEEFGVSSDFASDENAASYYRQVLHTSLLAGAEGWLAWNNCDYDDIRHQDPYRHHVFEVHFGLTDGEGRPKPQLRVLGEFASLVRELSRDTAGSVSPARPRSSCPSTSSGSCRSPTRRTAGTSATTCCRRTSPRARRTSRSSSSASATASPTRARLYLNPCAKLLTAPGLDRLRTLASEGATVYASYFAGSTPNQRGPWLSWLDELFGVRHQLRYGLVDPILEDEVVFQFVDDLGDITAGTPLSFHVAGEPSARAYLPVEADGAEVVAVDGQGRPALLRYAVGSGSTVLCTYPIEHMAARTPAVNPESTWRIYSALADAAGVARPVRVDDPRVLVGRLRTGASAKALFVNCSSERITAEPILSDAELDLPAGELTLEPFGVAAVLCEERQRAVVESTEGRDARA